MRIDLDNGVSISVDSRNEFSFLLKCCNVSRDSVLLDALVHSNCDLEFMFRKLDKILHPEKFPK